MRKPKHDINPFKYYGIIRSYICRKHKIVLSQLDVMVMMYDESVIALTRLYDNIARHQNLYRRMIKLEGLGLVHKLGKTDYVLSDKGILIVDDFYDILLNAANMDVNDIEEEDSSSYAILRCLKHMNKEAVKHQSMGGTKRWNQFREQRRQNGKK